MSGGASATAIAGVVGATAAVAGTALSVVSASNQAAAQSAQANYQSSIAKNNMILAQRAADRAKAQGEADAQEKALQTRQLMARQAAVLAGNGIDISGGSALDIFGDTAAIGSTDKQRILNNAQVTADNFLAQGSNFNAQSALYKATAAGDGGLGIAGTALGGLGTVADKWYKFNESGIFDSNPTYLGGGKT